MKIVHICLCGPVTDGWNYQDNMLTKFHKKMGNEVTIITSQSIYNQHGKLTKLKHSNYKNNDGVKVIRLEQILGRDVTSKLKIYKGLFKSIEEEQPDILFIHGINFLDIITIKKYLSKNNKVKVFVDNHSDFSNSATNWISLNLLHKIIWRQMAKIIEPYTSKFYGVMPSRVDFLINIYKTPIKKTELLVMGADDEKIAEVQNDRLINDLRKKYNIKENDFLIVTGGKIDEAKTQTLLLMEAIIKINRDDVKLIIFGSVEESLKEKFMNLCNHNNIQYIGWIASNESYKYFDMADLVVFPGRHSVFWEQVVAQEKPMICKYWEGTTHVDLGGNVIFINEDSVEEMYNMLLSLIDRNEKYLNMLDASKKVGKKFLYSNIAKISIN